LTDSYVKSYFVYLFVNEEVVLLNQLFYIYW